MSASTRRGDWDQLRAERAALRGELVAHLGALEARARDPFGLKDKIRRHPIVATALAAGVGAVLIRLILPSAPDAPPERRDAEARATRDEPSPVMEFLRTTLLRIAGPWIARFVEEHMGDLEGLFGAAAAGTGAVAADAVAAGAEPARGGASAPAPEVEPDAAPPDVPVA